MRFFFQISGVALASAVVGFLLAFQYGTRLLDLYVCPKPDGPNVCLLFGSVAAVIVTPFVFAAVAATIVSLWTSSKGNTQ